MYVKSVYRQDAETRTDAIIKNRNNASITAATAETIEKKEGIQAKNMMGLIDERAAIVVTNVDKAKKKKAGKEKDRTINLTEPVKKFPINSTASNKSILKKNVNSSDTRLYKTSVQDQGHQPHLNPTEISLSLPPQPLTTNPTSPQVMISYQQQLNLLTEQQQKFLSLASHVIPSKGITSMKTPPQQQPNSHLQQSEYLTITPTRLFIDCSKFGLLLNISTIIQHSPSPSRLRMWTRERKRERKRDGNRKLQRSRKRR